MIFDSIPPPFFSDLILFPIFTTSAWILYHIDLYLIVSCPSPRPSIAQDGIKYLTPPKFFSSFPPVLPFFCYSSLIFFPGPKDPLILPPPTRWGNYRSIYPPDSQKCTSCSKSPITKSISGCVRITCSGLMITSLLQVVNKLAASCELHAGLM